MIADTRTLPIIYAIYLPFFTSQILPKSCELTMFFNKLLFKFLNFFKHTRNQQNDIFLPIIYFANIYDIYCVHTLLHCIQIPASLISSRRPDIDLYKAWGLEETSFSQSFSFSSSRSASADRFNRASS